MPYDLLFNPQFRRTEVRGRSGDGSPKHPGGVTGVRTLNPSTMRRISSGVDGVGGTGTGLDLEAPGTGTLLDGGVSRIWSRTLAWDSDWAGPGRGLDWTLVWNSDWAGPGRGLDWTWAGNPGTWAGTVSSEPDSEFSSSSSSP